MLKITKYNLFLRMMEKSKNKLKPFFIIKIFYEYLSKHLIAHNYFKYFCLKMLHLLLFVYVHEQSFFFIKYKILQNFKFVTKKFPFLNNTIISHFIWKVQRIRLKLGHIFPYNLIEFIFVTKKKRIHSLIKVVSIHWLTISFQLSTA